MILVLDQLSHQQYSFSTDELEREILNVEECALRIIITTSRIKENLAASPFPFNSPQF